MQINGIDYASRINTLVDNNGAVSTSAATTTSVQQQQEVYARQTELNRTRIGMVDLSAKLNAVEDLIRTTTIRRSRSAEAMSKANLGLDTASLSSAVLKSTDEVNATPTSFSTFGPSWGGSSSALVTLDGVYDGSQGTDMLTFKVRRAGVHGTDRLKIQINGSDGSKLEEFNIGKSDPIDKQYNLANGLIFSLGSGSLSKKDTFTLNVYDGIGSVVDPSKPLAGVRNENPNFEYGLTVADGSFEVNGVNITVTAGDSLDDVLDRITSSEAEVTASFDTVTERVLLTQKNPGSDYNIAVGNDTSGFLAATKLSNAIVTPGTNGNVATPLSELAVFNSVQSGTLMVNDVEIALDVATDSLSDVLERISGSSAAVGAFTVDNRYVLIKANDRKSTLNLKDTNTGFFSALRIKEGDYQPVESGEIAKHRARKITEAMKDVVVSFNNLFRTSSSVVAEPVQEIRQQVKGAISETMEAAEKQKMPDLGIRFHFTPAQLTASFEDKERHTFERNLGNHYIDLREILIGPNVSHRGGLLGQLINILDTSLNNLGKFGMLVNAFA